MSFSFIENSVKPQTPDRTLNIWAYELAEVFKSFNEGSKVYAKSELADVSAMALLFQEQTESMFPDLCGKRALKELCITDLLYGLSLLYTAFGDVCHAYVHAQVFGKKTTKDSVENAIIAFFHVLYKFCDFCEWDYYELIKLGEKRYLERMQDIVKNGVKD
jgi:hypothetical protein